MSGDECLVGFVGVCLFRGERPERGKQETSWADEGGLEAELHME